MNSPLAIDLHVWTDVGFHETLEVDTDGIAQDFTNWTEFEFVVADGKAATILVEGTVQSPAQGKLDLAIEPAVLTGLFPQTEAKTVKDFSYVVRVKPGTGYKIRLIYGRVYFHKGLP